MTIHPETLIHALGWTLLHFLWQGALVAAIFGFVAELLKSSSANKRYVAACGALCLMATLPAATFFAHIRIAPLKNSGATVFPSTDPPPQDEVLGVATRGKELATETTAAPPAAPPAALRDWTEERFAPWLKWTVALWTAGVFLLLIRFSGAWLSVRRLRRRATKPVSVMWQTTFDRLARELRVSPPVRLCESALVEVPTVIGWLRPVVLVPARALHSLTPPQLRVLLAHELAHVKRYDYLVNLLQSAIEILLFYHPAVWWVSRQARVEREHACDDLAVMTTGDALGYARALTQLEQLRHDRDAHPSLALAADGGSLMKRIQRLVRIHLRPAPAERNAAPLIACLVALCACLTVVAGTGTTLLSAANEKSAERQPTTPSVSNRQVAITFVAFPGNNLHDDGRLTRKTRELMKSLAKEKIQAVGFVNEARLYTEDGAKNEVRVALLREWLNAGHELGNETARHTNLYKVSLEDFKADVLRGEQIMSGLARERGSRLRYFSYPYLNTGANLEAKRATETFLREHGYQIHPVTIDNMDWLFNKAYTEALRREDEAMMKAIRAEYVPYMELMFEFFENYSRETVGREFPQILMLTSGALNADTFDDLASMMKHRGYSFITMEEAMKDDAYSLPDNYTGVRGDSWIARWAVTKGLPYKDSEENLPPLMQRYFEDFLAEQRAKNASKK